MDNFGTCYYAIINCNLFNTTYEVSWISLSFDIRQADRPTNVFIPAKRKIVNIILFR